MLNEDGLRSFSAPTSLAGMRPVDIWKSTAAAPAPTRLGACGVPWASRPWQLEQFAWNSFLPAVTSCWAPTAAEACVTPPWRGERPVKQRDNDEPK